MSCLFTLVQLTDENLSRDRLTIGMIAIDEDGQGSACAFVDDWTRAKCFLHGGSTAFAKEFADSIRARMSPRASLVPSQLGLEELRGMLADFGNALQLSTLQEGAGTAEEWVDDLATDFVRDLQNTKAPRVQKDKVTKQALVRETRNFFQETLRDRYAMPRAEKVVEGRTQVHGNHETDRYLDSVIRNGRIHYGMLGITLDREFTEVQNSIDILTTSMDDIYVSLGIPLLVVAEASTAYDITEANLRRAKRQIEKRCAERPGVGFAQLEDKQGIVYHLERALTPAVVEELRAAEAA